MFINIFCPGIIDYSKFDNRQDGISGFMRIKNEEQFIEKAVLSWINFVDELVIVYNRCTDKTPAILKKLEKTYPNKIKLYHYIPIVYPFNTKKFQETNENSIHSFCFYSNFALSKTNYNICVKIDGDHIAIPKNLKKIYDNLKKNKMKNSIYYFNGFNIWNFKNKLYIDKNNPYCGNGDVFYFNIHQNNKFTKHPLNNNLEYLNVFSPKQFNLGFIFIHTHYLKNTFLKNFKKKNEFFILFNHENLKNINYDLWINKIIGPNLTRFKCPNHGTLYFDFRSIFQ